MNTSSAIKIIYRITNIGYWLFAVFATAVIIAAIILSFNGFTEVFNLEVNLPVEFHTSIQGEYKTGASGEVGVEIKKANAGIYFSQVPEHLRRVYGIFIIVLILPVFYFVHHFRKFTKNIYQKVFFDKSNISCLNNMSISLLLYWFVRLVFDIAGYMLFHDQFVFDGLSVADTFTIGIGFPTDGDGSLYLLAVAIFIWLLSVIFRYGANIQEENKLTI